MKKENMYQDEIEQQIINKVTPTKKDREKLEKNIKEIHEKIEKEVKKKKLPVKIELVGSTAKDTYLKDNLDIDFFLLFPLSFSKNEIAKHVLSIGKKILIKTEESYAEHPYIRGYYKKYKVEIVPCYQIEKAIQKLSAVDRTPLHTRYIKENLEEKQKKEVRLLKQFLKGINCYGAEAEIEGFSGYLCELLILKYGSFRKLIQQAQHWKPGETLMLTSNDKQHPVFDTPLTFIDPVDSNRNVASALSKEKFELFIKACQEYLKKPSITFFFPNPVKPWSIKEIKNKIIKEKMYFIGVTFYKPNIINENLYPQIRKTVKTIYESASKQGFTIHDITYHVGREKIYIIIKTDAEPLTETILHMGPPVKLKKNSKDFLKKWQGNSRVVKGPYEKNGRYFVEIKRGYRNLKSYLSSELKKLSLGKNIEEIVKSNYELLDLKDLLIDELKEFWTVYLDGKMSWER